MFDALLFRPVFNVLSGIYAIIPGHDFGVAIVIFTIIVRFAMWPLLKKQLHQAKVMRKIQPEIRELRQKHKGNRQAESMAMMELYKRYGVNPFASFGLLLVQLPIFIALFSALRAIIDNPHVLVERSYSFIENLPHMQEIVANTDAFNPSFLGIVNVTDYAYRGGAILWPALIIALLAGVFQYLLMKQLQPDGGKTTKPKKTMRQAIKEAQASGKEPDMSEIQANTVRRMGLFMPLLIIWIAAISPAGLAIYFTASGAVGWLQQSFVLGKDVREMEEMKITTTVKTEASPTKKKSSSRKKR